MRKSKKINWITIECPTNLWRKHLSLSWNSFSYFTRFSLVFSHRYFSNNLHFQLNVRLQNFSKWNSNETFRKLNRKKKNQRIQMQYFLTDTINDRHVVEVLCKRASSQVKQLLKKTVAQNRFKHIFYAFLVSKHLSQIFYFEFFVRFFMISFDFLHHNSCIIFFFVLPFCSDRLGEIWIKLQNGSRTINNR